jgi:hypothetical protein
VYGASTHKRTAQQIPEMLPPHTRKIKLAIALVSSMQYD